MSRRKTFDAVQIMRTIRDRMSEEMKGMTSEQRIEYIARQSGLPMSGRHSRRSEIKPRVRKGKPSRVPVSAG